MKNQETLKLAASYLDGDMVTDAQQDIIDEMIWSECPDWNGSRTGLYLEFVKEAAERLGKKIKRIVSIRDTRDYIEEGDRWIALSGTGDVRQCERCGRDHEVHATVELVNGSEAVVGTGCMKGDSFEKDLKNGASRAKTTRRLECELAAARARLEVVEAIEAEVATLERPPILEGTHRCQDGHEIPTLNMGDSQIWINGRPREDYDDRHIAQAWKHDQEKALGWTYKDDGLKRRIFSLEATIDKRNRS